MTAPVRRHFDLRLHTTPLDDAEARWTLRRWFAVGATIVAVLSLVAVALGVWSVVRIVNARDELYDRVGPAATAGQNLTAALLDQETGVRGYTIAPVDEFLTPYRNGAAAQADAVRTLVGLDPTQLGPTFPADLQAVTSAVDSWRTGYAEPAIAAARAGTPPPDAEAGRQAFDRVRSSVARLQADLQADRVIARDRLDSAISFLAWVGIAISIIAAATILLATAGVRGVILTPLRRLAGQTRAVVDGDVDQHVLGSGPREIVSLGADIEAMRSHIRSEVDELQIANTQLDERTRDLERSNRDLEQFAYVASHDLQEPLRKVSSFCQLLQRRYGGQLDDRADQYIDFAVDGAQRMQQLINDLLAFSRVGRTTTGFEPVDLGRAARTAAGQLAAAVEETGGEIVVPEGLPTVPGDPGLLQQLLFNLIGNGLKFHREDVPPVVRLSSVLRGEEYEITVADNGIGIEPEFADKIFVIFQRLHGREVYSGTGIGLALAKKIVEFHGGRIWMDPGPPDEPGTTFRVTLPVAQSGSSLPDPALAGTSKESS